MKENILMGKNFKILLVFTIALILGIFVFFYISFLINHNLVNFQTTESPGEWIITFECGGLELQDFEDVTVKFSVSFVFTNYTFYELALDDFKSINYCDEVGRKI